MFQKYIGIVSDNRNSKRIPFVVHLAHPYQICYGDIIGRYRMGIGIIKAFFIYQFRLRFVLFIV